MKKSVTFDHRDLVRFLLSSEKVDYESDDDDQKDEKKRTRKKRSVSWRTRRDRFMANFNGNQSSAPMGRLIDSDRQAALRSAPPSLRQWLVLRFVVAVVVVAVVVVSNRHAAFLFRDRPSSRQPIGTRDHLPSLLKNRFNVARIRFFKIQSKK